MKQGDWQYFCRFISFLDWLRLYLLFFDFLRTFNVGHSLDYHRNYFDPNLNGCRKEY